MSAPTAEITAKAPAGYNRLVGTTTFIWSPSQGVTKRFGDHMIVIPAGAICEPGVSGYGPGKWDLPCNAATRQIVITALSFVDAEGHPYVDFQPALRFVPTKEVSLYLRDGVRNGQDVTISYCATLVSCTDEAKTDPSVATKRIGRSRILYRRLKHFSGYVIAYAGDCSNGVVEQLEDGTLFCDTDGGRGGDSRSGYVVATGLGKTSTGDAFGRRRRADK